MLRPTPDSMMPWAIVTEVGTLWTRRLSRAGPTAQPMKLSTLAGGTETASCPQYGSRRRDGRRPADRFAPHLAGRVDDRPRPLLAHHGEAQSGSRADVHRSTGELHPAVRRRRRRLGTPRHGRPGRAPGDVGVGDVSPAT